MSKSWAVAWVIKEWRLDAVANSLVDRAQEAAEAIRAEAERDARRARRVARREAVDATEYLAVLERLGIELHATVRHRRGTVVREQGARAELTLDAPKLTALAEPQLRSAERRRRGGRASLRTRAVAELFQATEPLPARRA